MIPNIEVNGNVFILAISIAEKIIGDSWLEALSHSKVEARILGAKRIIHSSKNHLTKIENGLIDLMTVA